MGRKSSSSTTAAAGDLDGGGGVGQATMMGLRMIQCGRQTIHVVQPDGQLRQFVLPVRVADLLRLYPHCFVSLSTPAAAAGDVSRSGRRPSSSGILPYDAYLETGSMYAIHPLPRLFPFAPPATPHFCSCFFPSETSARFFFGGAGKATSSRISPDTVQSPAPQPLPRRLWEPELEMISEDRVLVVSERSGEASAAGKKEGPSRGRKLAAAFDGLRLR